VGGENPDRPDLPQPDRRPSLDSLDPALQGTPLVHRPLGLSQEATAEDGRGVHVTTGGERTDGARRRSYNRLHVGAFPPMAAGSQLLFTVVVLAGAAWFFARILTNENCGAPIGRGRRPRFFGSSPRRPPRRPGAGLRPLPVWNGVFRTLLGRPAARRGAPCPSPPDSALTTSATSANTRRVWACRP